MADVVVTVPKNFRYQGKTGLAAWISEGDAAGELWSGQEWDFYIGRYAPSIQPGERVYIVCEGKLRGYSRLVRVEFFNNGRYSLVRRGDAEAITINEPIPGFRGFRYRWWDYKDEKPFPNWQTP